VKGDDVDGRTAGRDALVNPPGRPALAYRVATHADVLERCLSTLLTRLPALTVRGTDDPAVALLDAWATVADIVTFYQERIANEGFLRTATERRSVLELARAIGYELGPGVAASAYLAFTVEDAPGAPARAVVPAGTRVQSVPGQGELPQTFETSQEIVAVAGWNSVGLRLWREQRVGDGATELRLTGVTTGLRPGDGLLVRSGRERWGFRILRTVELSPADETGRPPTTVVGWDGGLELAAGQGADQGVEVYAFRLRAAIFGHNAPDWRIMPKDVRTAYARTGPDGGAAFDNAVFDTDVFDTADLLTEWPGFGLPRSPGDGGPVIDLDAAYPAILPGSWLVLRAPGVPDHLYQVATADLSAAADFGLTATTTRLRLLGEGDLSPFGRRATAVYAQSERLEPAGVPVTEPVTGPELLLDRPAALTSGTPAMAPGTLVVAPGTPVVAPGTLIVAPGTLVVVTGSTVAGLPVAEPAHIATASPDGTRIVLTAPLERPLVPSTVRVLGNVVEATAGQTVEEVLGSGDGGAANQRFTLPHKNLTHTPAPVSGGARDSLEVRVDGVAWTEAGSLFSLGPHDRSYVVRIGDDAAATVVFGDGERGGRLPSGQENVRATYRTGLGPEGNVGAGALSLLLTRPLGVRGVGNPMPASGGAAPERLEDARANTPRAVRTLDRVVSLTDHEDFARAFAGIAKARAVVLRAGGAPFVHVTVAAPGGGEMSGVTLAALRGALDGAGRPGGRLDLQGYLPLSFAVSAGVVAAADRERDVVFQAVADAIRAGYSFDRRDFAQTVTAAEVLTVIQRVPGVVAANLTSLYLIGPGQGATAVADILPARGARVATRGEPGPAGVRTAVAPAELLLVDPARIVVREMTP
jgi:predicted phage baseplate assembly protein